MDYTPYDDFSTFLEDDSLISLLGYDKEFDDLLTLYTEEDFLTIDSTMRIPFFAETRDYIGAREVETPENRWLVKPIDEMDIIIIEMAMIIYFLDICTNTYSAPVAITRINGTLYKATKLISKSEQLTGADYTNIPILREQLLLELVNRWIYYDEDRNPNNYMIKYTSTNKPILIAIDFGNSDLLFKDNKITGTEGSFGWDRSEKTRYLTPLKADNFLNYDINFYNIRLKYFQSIDRETLTAICDRIIRFSLEKDMVVELVTNNLLKRIKYVSDYFNTYIPKSIETTDKYSKMGGSFQKMFDNRR